jgi:hypothetical protein
MREWKNGSVGVWEYGRFDAIDPKNLENPEPSSLKRENGRLSCNIEN